MRPAFLVAVPFVTMALAGCSSALIPLASSLLGPHRLPQPGSPDSLPFPVGGSSLGSGVLFRAEGGAMLGMRLMVFRHWDTESDNLLSFDEYRSGILAMLDPPLTPAQTPSVEAQIHARFARLDADRDGYLSEGEFQLPIRDGRVIRDAS